MEFLVLGPLEVRHDGEPIELRGSKRRALLALLILHANEVVRTDRLVDELWGEHPPRTATTSLHNLVLAGDWTDTGLPATIEGSVRSGFAAATAVLAAMDRAAQEVSA